MRLSLRSLLGPSLALSLSLASPLALAQDDASARTWQMFAHFVNVARPDQAKPFGQQLLAMDNAAFLAAIEADPNHQFGEIAKWGINDDLRPVWEQIEDKYQEAQTERARDPQQIRDDISKLGGDRRAEYNAIQRLKVTGQFAAPYYLEVLIDPAQNRLHPRVINAMVEVGDELSYPLAVALPNLDAATQVMVARVLGEIGYPEALPYLKLVIDGSADANVKRACQTAFDQVVSSSGVDATGSASQLFTKVGQAKYAVGTRNDELLGMDLGSDTGILWRYNNDDRIGDIVSKLIPIAVPQHVYADILAMQNATSALKLDPEAADAVTLHLTANLRRENRLDGAADPSYQLSNPPAFYLLVSGASQQKSVLATGLADQDAALSLDAVQSLAKTAGDSVLLGDDDNRAPVIDALYFADRRVRFTAAITLASAAPAQEFPGSISVMPVLGQAIRQSDTPTAMVVVPGDPDPLTSALEQVEYKAVGAVDINQAATKAIEGLPGVDLIVYSGNFDGFEAMYAAAKADGMLSVVPVLALVDDGVASAIRLNYPGVVTAAPLSSTSDDAEIDRLEKLANQAVQGLGGEAMGADEALAYAETAMGLVKTIAGHDSIYDAADVQPILVEALDDDRPTIATGAAEVLALMDSAAAQQAIATAALGRVGDVQIAMLGSLAESAKSFGNQCDRATVDKLIQLVNTSQGETALAAARALGALTERPTSDTTGFILGK